MNKVLFSILRMPTIPGFMVPGVMYDHRTPKDGFPFAITGENDELLIDKGIYRCVRAMYYGGDGVGGKRDYPTFQILVPGRDEVKFHILNEPKTQSLGCIGIAEYFGEILGRLAIQNSAGGFNEFMSRAAEVNEFMLEIKEGAFA